MNNIVVVSDIHAGCGFGLCPPEVKLDQGIYVKSSPLQKKVWKMWSYFWDVEVPLATKDEPYIIVFNGDAIDGTHHGSKTQITQNISDQIEIAYQCLAPRVEKAQAYFHIRGTEAHVGKSAEFEEILARRLGAVPDADNNHARWELWLRFAIASDDPKLAHFTHHVGTTSSAAYESTAVFKELVEAYNEAGRYKEEPPDIVVRSHRHRAMEIKVPSGSGQALAVVTPGWQLKTPFVYRGALGRAGTPHLGGIIIRHGGEVPLYVRSKFWKIERPKVEVVNV